MKMKIERFYVLSYRRSHLLNKDNLYCTYWNCLNRTERQRTYYVVEAEEEEKYQRKGVQTLVLMEPGVRGPGRIRQRIIEHARGDSLTNIAILDDDLHLNVYPGIDDIWSSSLEITDRFSPEAACFGFGLGETGDWDHLSQLEAVAVGSYQTAAFGLLLDRLPESVRFDAFEFNEDHAFILQLLLAGCLNLRFRSGLLMHDVVNEDGGCFEFRTYEANQRDIDAFIDRWPEYANSTWPSWSKWPHLQIDWRLAAIHGGVL